MPFHPWYRYVSYTFCIGVIVYVLGNIIYHLIKQY